ILGCGMSDKMWEAIVKHAKTCELGNKLYMFRGPDFLLILNPICEVVSATIGNQIYSSRNDSNIPKEYLENLRRQAFDDWFSLQDFEGNLGESSPHGNEGSNVLSENLLLQSGYQILRGQLECQDWDFNPEYNISATIQENFHYN
ncbi:unnamed protein product, partial [Citrullus colocynthis]